MLKIVLIAFCLFILCGCTGDKAEDSSDIASVGE